MTKKDFETFKAICDNLEGASKELFNEVVKLREGFEVILELNAIEKAKHLAKAILNFDGEE